MKTALLFGSSGLVGSELLNLIIQSNKYDNIKLFVRSETSNNHPKIEIIKTDFNNLNNHKNSIVGDDCFFCIGTTRKNTPDKNEYIRIEYSIPIEVAKIALTNSVNNFIYVSSLGANPNASGLYLKNKGQAEEELIKLNFQKLSIIRPSILLGNRKENRIGEKIGIFIMQTLSPLFLGKLKKYKPIKVENVAKAILSIAQNNYKNQIIESDQLVKICNL
jgi:nucleoside-diphosphate-sugar epimerase